MLMMVVAAVAAENAVCTSAAEHEAALMVCASARKRTVNRIINGSHFISMVVGKVPFRQHAIFRTLEQSILFHRRDNKVHARKFIGGLASNNMTIVVEGRKERSYGNSIEKVLP
jgi:hypothetical protein